MYWNETAETMAPMVLRRLQVERLGHLIKYAQLKSPYYTSVLRSLDVSAIGRLADLATLPFTNPRLLIEDPVRFRSGDRICRVHCSGGTLASPKILFFTSEDLNAISDLAARKFYMMGVRSEDRVALMQPFDIYLVGFGHLEAYKKIGAEVMPLGVRLEQDFVIRLMQKLQPTVIDSSPSAVLRLTNDIVSRGINPAAEFSVSRVVLAGEKVTRSLRKSIESAWSTEVFNDYGLEEMGIVAAECHEHRGLHVATDQYIVEVVDPSSLQLVAQGQIGELVLTPLELRGMVLLRYRTGDLVRLVDEQCVCGRTHPRVELLGRVDETLMVEGIKLYAYQFDQALEEFASEVLNYQVVYENVGKRDWLRFMCEAEPLADKETVKSRIFNALRHVSIDFLEILEKSSIEVDVQVVEPFAISSTTRGKTKRFIDRRSEGE